MSTPPDTDGFEQSRTPHEEFAQSTVHDRELSQNNFGAGVYKNAEVYEQTRRFKQTLNANAGVGQAIERLARGEVFRTIGAQGWTVESGDEKFEIQPLEDAAGTKYEEQAKRARERDHWRHSDEMEYGREVFETLPDYLQTHAITELSSLETRFDPPEMRIIKFFHEASRSKGGRLMDNVFGRVKKRILEGMDSDSKKRGRLFGGGN